MKFGSLFSGIGGFDLAFERAGMECAWQVEIDDKCRDVLTRHWPNVPKFGDIRDVGRHNLDSVDVICGGPPCQDFSVAGQRAGLAGERSGLWFEMRRVLAELKPRWVVIENVPGLLSGCGCTTCQAIRRIIKIHAWLRKRQGGVECPVCVAGRRMLESHSGRNFTILLQGLVELGYSVSWRIHDAQYAGVAQRRRRVFVVASSPAAGGRSAQVLFERESSAWDSPPSREAGQGFARDVAPCLAASGRGTERTRESRGQDAVVAYRGNNTSGPIDIATACNAHGSRRYDFESETFVAFDRTRGTSSGDITGPLRKCGAATEGVNDAKADTQCVAYTVHGEHSTAMTGDGVAKVAFETDVTRCLDSNGGYATNQGGNVVAYGVSENQRAEVRLTEYSRQITSGGGKPGQGYPCVAIRNSGRDADMRPGRTGTTTQDDVMFSLQAEQQHAVAFQPRYARNGRGAPDEIAAPLTAEAGRTGKGDSAQCVAFDWQSGGDVRHNVSEHHTSALQSSQVPAVSASWGVRRLTPVECCRLQGLPDDWVDGEGQSDSAKYRQLGNAVCEPVVRWIGKRIVAVEEGTL